MEHPVLLLFEREKKTKRNRKTALVCVGANAFGTRQKVNLYICIHVNITSLFILGDWDRPETD